MGAACCRPRPRGFVVQRLAPASRSADAGVWVDTWPVAARGDAPCVDEAIGQALLAARAAQGPAAAFRLVSPEGHVVGYAGSV